MKLAQSLCCREMKKIDVVDSSGSKVGHVGDMTFTFDKGLKLSKFILAGPRFEEFLESIKVKPDRDPVFDSSLITKVDEKIHLDREETYPNIQPAQGNCQTLAS